MKKMIRRFMAAITTAALFTVSFVQAMPASAATMHSIYYSAGDVDNMVSSSTFTFAVPEGGSFEYCAASRFSRKGYKISSWYVQETGQTVGVTQPSFMPAYDLHVTANWEPVTYNICLAGVGGVTAAGENNIYVDGTYGTSINLPSNPFTKDGYTFAGWEYNNVRYAEGEAFEVPAVISGGRVVLAAAWNKGEAAVTQAPAEEIITTTTTTTTEITTQAPETTEAPDGTVKYFYPNASFGGANESFKLYISDILGRYDSLESIEFTFYTDNEKFGNVSVGFATMLTNGETYQKNFAEYANDDTFTMTLDKDICSQLSYGRFFQFMCWQSDSFPFQLSKVKTIVKENAFTTTTEEEEEEEETTTTTTTTTTEATTEETTTTTTTTEATTEETTTTTTTTTEATTEETTTTTTTTEEATETTTEETTTTTTTETTPEITSETTTEVITEDDQPTAEDQLKEMIDKLIEEFIRASLKGDADLDGVVSLTDIIVVSKNNISSVAYPFINAIAAANADMNGDKQINGIDASALIEFNLGK